MDIKTCRMCGKIFQSKGANQCPLCLKAMDEKFVVVRNYIFDNPAANMKMICDDNDIDEDTVMRWIREGRLLVSSGSAIGLTCVKCGKPIGSGKFCLDCSDELKGQMDSATRNLLKNIDKQNQKSGIHTESLRRR